MDKILIAAWVIFASAIAGGMAWENRQQPEQVFMMGWSHTEPPDGQCIIKVYSDMWLTRAMIYHKHTYYSAWDHEDTWTSCPTDKEIR